MWDQIMDLLNLAVVCKLIKIIYKQENLLNGENNK